MREPVELVVVDGRHLVEEAVDGLVGVAGGLDGLDREGVHQLQGDVGEDAERTEAERRGLQIRIVLVDDLTRGIDVSAKFEIYKILKSLRESGLSILMVSSELAEILAESDRILVMKNGAMVADLRGEQRTKEQVIRYALSGQ